MPFTPNVTQRTAPWVSAAEFGAVGNGVTDDAAALQDMINYCQTNKVNGALQSGLVYRIASALTFSPIRSDFAPIIFGNDATISVDFVGVGVHITPVPTTAMLGDGVAYPQLRDLTFTTPRTTGVVGAVVLGAAGRFGYSHSYRAVLENVQIKEFPGVGLELYQASHTAFEKVTIRTALAVATSTALRITGNVSGAFTGDYFFHDCQFGRGTNGGNSVQILSVGGAQVRGLHFEHCIIYNSNFVIESQANSQAGDIWLNSCQFDQGQQGVSALKIFQNGGQIDKINISDIYMVGYDSRGIELIGTNPAMMTEVNILGGSISLVQDPIFATYAGGFEIKDVQFWQCGYYHIAPAAYAEINIGEQCQKFSICDNTKDSGNCPYFISLSGTGTSRFQVSGNVGYNGTLLNDVTGAVSKQVLNNQIL